MDNKIRAILESIPKKRQRSKLEPYAELIEQLRRRGHTFREIVGILAEKCELVVDSSTIVRFVAARLREKRKHSKRHEMRKTHSIFPAKNKTNISPTVTGDDLRKRIDVLKQQPSKTVQSSKQFEYDPDQPLQLPHKG